MNRNCSLFYIVFYLFFCFFTIDLSAETNISYTNENLKGNGKVMIETSQPDTITTNPDNSLPQSENSKEKTRRNEIKMNILSLVFANSLEVGYEYVINAEKVQGWRNGVGAYITYYSIPLNIVQSSNNEGFSITPYTRVYYRNDIFWGFDASYSHVDYSNLLGFGTMVGYKGAFGISVAELAANFVYYPHVLFDNGSIKTPLYIGLTLAVGFRL